MSLLSSNLSTGLPRPESKSQHPPNGAKAWHNLLSVGGEQVLREFTEWMNDQYLKGYCDYMIEGLFPFLIQMHFILDHIFHFNERKACDLPSIWHTSHVISVY